MTVKVLFHTNQINFRGTTVAVADYARYNQLILGNESIIGYFHDSPSFRDGKTEPLALQSLQKEFEIRSYIKENMESYMSDIDFAYFLRAGSEEQLPKNVKTGVHSVFQFNEPHGDAYAYISEWLSNKMSNGILPYVPHIVALPEPKTCYRDIFGIRNDQIVIGRFGGLSTFDIPFVKEAIVEILESDDRYKFLLLNTDPFIRHPNVIHVNAIVDPLQKSNFIHTCDGFIHARTQGESFGLSICESLFLNKPVLAFNGGSDQHHIDLLSSTDLLYDQFNVKEKMLSINDHKGDYKGLVDKFNPTTVIEKFNKVFLGQNAS
jgi:hypothetical protein